MKRGIKEVIMITRGDREIARVKQGTRLVYEKPYLNRAKIIVAAYEYWMGIAKASHYSNHVFYLNNPLYCKKLSWQDLGYNGTTYVNANITTDSGTYRFNTYSNVINNSTTMKSVSTKSGSWYTIDLTQFGNNPRLTSFQAAGSAIGWPGWAELSSGTQYAGSNMYKQLWSFKECSWDDIRFWENYVVSSHLSDFYYDGTPGENLYNSGSFWHFYNPGYCGCLEWSYNNESNDEYSAVYVYVGPPEGSPPGGSIGTSLVLDTNNNTINGLSMRDYSTQRGDRYVLDLTQFGDSPRVVGFSGDYYNPSKGHNGYGALSNMIKNNWIFKA